MTGERIDLARAAEQIGVAAAALTRWYARQTTATDTYVAAGNDAVAAIDAAVRALYEARGRLVDEYRTDENDRARRVDAMLAARRGEKCLHGEDARHRSAYGPPVYVGCGCALICCAVAEHTAQGGAA